MPTAHPNDLLDQLPHGEAFRFVSEVESITPGESGVGVWQLTGDEPFFAGHFPGNPIVPGVLIGEALAQFSGLVANSRPDSPPAGALLAQLDIRLKRPVAPPARITLESTLTRAVGPLTQFDVVARTNEGIVARGSLTLASYEGNP